MDAVELLEYSFQNAFDILAGVAADLTQEQVDWVPPGTANSIGTLYWHLISGADQVIQVWCKRQPALFEEGGWKDRVLIGPESAEEGDHAGRLLSVCVDLQAMRDYASAVQEATMTWVSSLAAHDLDRTLQTPIGELNLGQMLESFVVWHINAHCGEISALKGCQGARGYPF